MDEHDKRAREVAKAVLGPLNADAAYIAFVAARIGTLFRGLTAAAVAAERERCRAIAAEFGADEAWHPERRHASSSIADAIAAAASPAQAERVSEDGAHFMDLLAAHARGAAETTFRIAARLRARADEVAKKADESRARWLAHEDRDGDAEFMRRMEFASTVLRSEADALEGT